MGPDISITGFCFWFPYTIFFIVGFADPAATPNWTAITEAEQSERLLLRDIALLEDELTTAKITLSAMQEAALADFQVRAEEAKESAREAMAGLATSTLAALEDYKSFLDEIHDATCEIVPCPDWVKAAHWFASPEMPYNLGDLVNNLHLLENINVDSTPRAWERVLGPDGSWGLEPAVV